MITGFILIALAILLGIAFLAAWAAIDTYGFSLDAVEAFIENVSDFAIVFLKALLVMLLAAAVLFLFFLGLYLVTT